MSFRIDKRLQEDGPLTPGSDLGDGPAMVIIGQRRFDARRPVGHVVGGQNALVPVAAGVHHLGLVEIGLDRLGDEATVKGVARRFDLRFAAALAFGLGNDPLPRFAQAPGS